MAIVSDIGTLKTEITSYLYDRTDLASQVPNFIDMAQARIFRVLKCRENEAVSSGSLVTNSYTVPSDYRSLKYMLVNDLPLDAVSESELRLRLKNESAGGEPKVFCRINNAFVFHPAPDATYDIDLYYYADVSSDVTSDTATNSVMTTHPDLYVFGSLMMAAPYLNEDERIPTWEKYYMDTLTMIVENTSDELYSGSPIQVQAVYYDR